MLFLLQYLQLGSFNPIFQLFNAKHFLGLIHFYPELKQAISLLNIEHEGKVYAKYNLVPESELAGPRIILDTRISVHPTPSETNGFVHCDRGV